MKKEAGRALRAIKKGLFGVLALTAASQASALDPAYSGAWSNPAKSGHGFYVTVLDAQRASVAWYTYDSEGKPIWLLGVMTENSPGVISGDLSYVHGMKFSDFNPQDVQVKTWGTLKMTVTDCETASAEYNGTLALSGAVGQGTMPLKKAAGVAGVTCSGTRAALAGSYAGITRPNNITFNRQSYSLFEPDGTFTMGVVDSYAYFGTYTVQGSTVNYNLTGLTVGGLKFPNNTTSSPVTATSSSRPHDYYDGTYTGGGETGILSGAYLGSSARTPTLAAIAGNYAVPQGGGLSGITATVTAAGAISGKDGSNCNFSGTIAPAPGVNAFKVSVAVTNCGGENGNYEGRALVIDWNAYGDGRGLVLALRGPANSIAAAIRRQ